MLRHYAEGRRGERRFSDLDAYTQQVSGRKCVRASAIESQYRGGFSALDA